MRVDGVDLVDVRVGHDDRLLHVGAGAGDHVGGQRRGRKPGFTQVPQASVGDRHVLADDRDIWNEVKDVALYGLKGAVYRLRVAGHREGRATVLVVARGIRPLRRQVRSPRPDVTCETGKADCELAADRKTGIVVKTVNGPLGSLFSLGVRGLPSLPG